jgi:hypothetical protein
MKGTANTATTTVIPMTTTPTPTERTSRRHSVGKRKPFEQWNRQPLHGARSGRAVKLHAVVAECDLRAHRRTHRATVRDAWPTRLGSVPSTCKSVGWQAIAMLRFLDGKTIEQWVVLDELSQLQQLGAIRSNYGPQLARSGCQRGVRLQHRLRGAVVACQATSRTVT